jgi:hypothetical protein
MEDVEKEEVEKKEAEKPFPSYGSYPKKKPKPKPKPVYVATSTCTYRFKCDGTTKRLTKGVSPQDMTEAQKRELLKFDRIREVK